MTATIATPNVGTFDWTEATTERQDRTDRVVLAAGLACGLLYAVIGMWTITRGQYMIGDAAYRVANARVILFSRDPHLAAIGMTWMPLSTMATLPFAAVLEPFGLGWAAGSLMTATFGGATVVMLSRFARQAGAGPVATAVVIALYALNPVTMFWMGSAMMEAPTLFFLTWACRSWITWLDSRRVGSLAAAGLALGFGVLTRYEQVLVTAAFCGLGVLAERRGRRFATIVVIALPSAVAITFWCAVNFLIRGDALSFLVARRPPLRLRPCRALRADPGRARAVHAGARSSSSRPIVTGARHRGGHADDPAVDRVADGPREGDRKSPLLPQRCAGRADAVPPGSGLERPCPLRLGRHCRAGAGGGCGDVGPHGARSIVRRDGERATGDREPHRCGSDAARRRTGGRTGSGRRVALCRERGRSADRRRRPDRPRFVDQLHRPALLAASRSVRDPGGPRLRAAAQPRRDEVHGRARVRVEQECHRDRRQAERPRDLIRSCPAVRGDRRSRRRGPALPPRRDMRLRRRPAPHTSVSAAAYDAGRAGWHEDRRLEMVVPLLPARPGSLVVELGCGSGRFLSRLAAARPDLTYVGIDIDALLIEHARTHHGRSGVEFELGDVTQEWNRPQASLVVSVDMLHHVPDTERLYHAMHRRMERGARWLAFEPNVWHPAVTFSQERMKRAGLGEDHFRPWRELPRLRSAGFVIESRRYLLAAPQGASLPALLEPPLRLIERVPVVGASLGLLLCASSSSAQSNKGPPSVHSSDP
ncbi:MAG: methyltransferase domain-containing protein [Actinobacteria bacterium]|nr:methyltransferase domain-containing protein [Actinomycetota bacterium]